MIAKETTDKVLISQTTQYQKSRQPNQKVGKGPEEASLQRRHTDGQQTHEKILNIAHF